MLLVSVISRTNKWIQPLRKAVQRNGIVGKNWKFVNQTDMLISRNCSLSVALSWLTSTPSNFSKTLAYWPRSRIFSHCRTSRCGLGDSGILRRDRELREGKRKLQAIPVGSKEKRVSNYWHYTQWFFWWLFKPILSVIT